MQFHYTPYILPLLASAVIAGAVAMYAWRRRSTPSAIALSLLALAIMEWTLGYALEIAGADLPTKIFWGKIQYIGIVATPLLWLIFAVHYTDRGKWLSQRNLFLLAIIPLITVVLAFTTESHSLIWKDIQVYEAGNFSVLDVSYGFWFWVHSVYSYLLLAAGTLLILRSVGRRQGMYRGQAIALIVAVAAPWIGNALYLAGRTPIPHLDLTPFAFTISVVALTWGIFRFHLIDLSPVARDLVVEEMNDGMIVLDAQGRIADINPAAQRMINLSPSQAIGQTITDVLKPWPQIVERFRGVLEEQAEIALGEGDDRRWYEIRLSPLYDQRHRSIGRVIIVQNITERKRVQEELARAHDQALEASRYKSELIAKVSHELRTPLSAILGYAEFLYKETFAPLTPQQKHFTAEILDSVKYLNSLINDLLDVSQIERGTVKIQIAPFEVRKMVDQVGEALAPLAKTRGLRFTTEVAPDLPAALPGDQRRVRQILTNLVNNAIKFTEKGSVAVHIKLADQQHWVMQVTDTGPGISTEAQARIFESFWQADGSSTRKQRGHGLGLSIVKQLTELMGGEVTLDSTLGRGSTFKVVLPLEAPTGDAISLFQSRIENSI